MLSGSTSLTSEGGEQYGSADSVDTVAVPFLFGNVISEAEEEGFTGT